MQVSEGLKSSRALVRGRHGLPSGAARGLRKGGDCGKAIPLVLCNGVLVVVEGVLVEGLANPKTADARREFQVKRHSE